MVSFAPPTVAEYTKVVLDELRLPDVLAVVTIHVVPVVADKVISLISHPKRWKYALVSPSRLMLVLTAEEDPVEPVPKEMEG